MTLFQQSLAQHLATFEQIRSLESSINTAAKQMIDCLERQGKILWCGNGGSAADCQHLAAELVGRFTRERRALASIALTTDTSILTAVANDYDYDKIFSRQVEGLATDRDLLVGISTSGQSRNVIEAILAAQKLGVKTLVLTGRDGGALMDLADLTLNVPAQDTARIQEAHIFIGHHLCDMVEAHFATSD